MNRTLNHPPSNAPSQAPLLSHQGGQQREHPGWNPPCAGPGPEAGGSAPPGSWPRSSGPRAPHPRPWHTAEPAGCWQEQTGSWVSQGKAGAFHSKTEMTGKSRAMRRWARDEVTEADWGTVTGRQSGKRLGLSLGCLHPIWNVKLCFQFLFPAKASPRRHR